MDFSWILDGFWGSCWAQDGPKIGQKAYHNTHQKIVPKGGGVIHGNQCNTPPLGSLKSIDQTLREVTLDPLTLQSCHKGTVADIYIYIYRYTA